MNKRLLVAIPVIGGILTGLAWTSWCSGLILLISLIPFFYVENYLYENRETNHPNSVFVLLAPGLLVFNIIALGWVHVASFVAAIFLILASTFFMTFVIWLAHIVRLKMGNFYGILAFVSFWLSLEFLNLTTDPFNPWLNLGNGLAKDIQFIQWYDITGTAGGTLWILLSNIIAVMVIVSSPKKLKVCYLYSALFILLLIVPVSVSFVKYFKNGTPGENKTEVVIVQPNIDPYSEKFNRSFEEQLELVLQMAEKGVTDNTKWVIAPETTIDNQIDENHFENNKYIIRIKMFLKAHPGINLVIGATTIKENQVSLSKAMATAKKKNSSDQYFNIYNSALNIDTGKQIVVYHKSKLVPGIEKQFNGIAGKITGVLLPYLGGTPSGYGTQAERTIFMHTGNNQKVAPIICYESVFGEFITTYVKNGANLVFIITNDGWWKNTNGYKQHLSYASIRAIETRRSVARAANTGISCFIDKRGVISSSSAWWEPAIISGNISIETRITPYVRYGDYILHIGNIVSILILILLFGTFARKEWIKK